MAGTFDFGQQGRNARRLRCGARCLERGCRIGDPQTAQSQFRPCEFRARQQGPRQLMLLAGRSLQRGFRGIDFAHEQKSSRGDQSGVGRIHRITQLLERPRHRLQPPLLPAQIACRQRHLGFGQFTSRARQTLLRPKLPPGPPQQLPPALVLAELRHRDAAERQRRSVLPQGDAVQRAQRVACRQRVRCARDQRVHADRVTRPC